MGPLLLLISLIIAGGPSRSDKCTNEWMNRWTISFKRKPTLKYILSGFQMQKFVYWKNFLFKEIDGCKGWICQILKINHGLHINNDSHNIKKRTMTKWLEKIWARLSFICCFFQNWFNHINHLIFEIMAWNMIFCSFDLWHMASSFDGRYWRKPRGRPAGHVKSETTTPKPPKTEKKALIRFHKKAAPKTNFSSILQIFKTLFCFRNVLLLSDEKFEQFLLWQDEWDQL